MGFRGRPVAFLCFAVVLLSGCAGSAPDADLESGAIGGDDATGSVVGRIVDDEWMPIKGAEVTLAQAERMILTGPGGGFSFDRVEPGSYTLRVLKLGFFQKTIPITVESGRVTEVDVSLEQVPVADPPFDDVSMFHGNLTLGIPEGPVAEGVDSANYPLTLPDRSEDGVLLAAVATKIELLPAEMAHGEAVDLDLYLLSPSGEEVDRSTTSGAYEVIEYPALLMPGEYTILVHLWAGAAAEFDVRATVTYEQGEAAEYAFKKKA